MKKLTLVLTAIVLPCVLATAQAGSKIGGNVKIKATVKGAQTAIASGALTEAINAGGSIRDYDIDGDVDINASVMGAQTAIASGVRSKAVNAVGTLYGD